MFDQRTVIMEEINGLKQKRRDLRQQFEKDMTDFEIRRFENMKNEFINKHKQYLVRQ